MNKIITLLLFLCSVLFFTTLSVQAEGLERPVPTDKEIIRFIETMPFEFTKVQPYKKQPSVNDPGKTMNDSALNMLNFIRLLSGLPAVSENENYSDLAQSASYIMNRGHQFSHYLTPPQGMSSEDLLFKKGKHAARSSNIGFGYQNIVQSIMTGYMYDEDASNIEVVGHRKWLLDPTLQAVGFGQVKHYTALYVFDHISTVNKELPTVYNWTIDQLERNAAKYVDGEIKIAWPPENMPIQYSPNDLPFSLSLGASYSLDKPIIQMTNSRTGQQITIDSEKLKKNEHYSVSPSGYGKLQAIVWRPNSDVIHYKAGDQWTIHIDGLQKEGQVTYIEYKITLFDLQKSLPEIAVQDNMTVFKDEKFSIKSKRDYNYSSDAVFWTSSNDTDFSFSTKDKKVISKRSPNTFIARKIGVYYARMTNDNKLNVKITVIEDPSIVKLIKTTKNVSVKKGQRIKIKATVQPTTAKNKKLSYSSANKKIATVSKTGSVKGVSKGQTTITIRSANQVTKKVSIQIK
ncbi:Ig-like domain-containing protein [Kurthia sibirica]|uniref:BIG2 domain-containing protein n=1 Tax=Kurthia sibirica TaxID=202750 RepID=A0A2U3APK9_9BACL|nr:Ig-like domain-containing protein [Kurthia sibirica]PWI26471.1 hypothetical protein DEX24_03840 [Kurthia sibirica]GEK33040.1 hypothetical protein KSI01_05730 [Kurthia sibirica]